jgi:hypothetical protein
LQWKPHNDGPSGPQVGTGAVALKPWPGYPICCSVTWPWLSGTLPVRWEKISEQLGVNLFRVCWTTLRCSIYYLNIWCKTEPYSTSSVLVISCWDILYPVGDLVASSNVWSTKKHLSQQFPNCCSAVTLPYAIWGELCP